MENGMGVSTLDPPAFSPSKDMRDRYLMRHLEELQNLRLAAENNDWKTVRRSVSKVRGSAAMFGFPQLGSAADMLFRAMEIASEDSLKQLFDTYFSILHELNT